MRLSKFYMIYSRMFVLGPAIEKIYSQVRLMLSPTVRSIGWILPKLIDIVSVCARRICDTTSKNISELPLLIISPARHEGCSHFARERRTMRKQGQRQKL
jgi:hypothetical protein